MISDAKRTITLKKEPKLSTVTNPAPDEVLKANPDKPNCSITKILVTIKPTIEMYGKTFLCSLNIKSTRTIRTSVNEIASSGFIKTKSEIICSKFKTAYTL